MKSIKFLRLLIGIMIGSIIILLLVLAIQCNVSKGKPYRVGVSNGYVGNNWRNQMMNNLYEVSQFYEEEGLIEEIIIKNAGDDVNNQISQIKYLIESDVDLLLIDPNHYTMLEEVIGEAVRKGIVVVVFDQNVSSQEVYQVTIDQKEWGRELASWITEEMGDRGNLLIMAGVEGQPCNDLRLEGMMEVLGEKSEVYISDTVYGDWDQSMSNKLMKESLAKYTNIDGILCQDGMAFGVIQALEASDAAISLMTGEVMNAYIDKSKKLSNTSDFTTFALTNPPGIGATALSLGLYILENDLADNPQLFHFPYKRILIKNGEVIGNDITYGDGSTHYYDEWYSLEEIEENFFGDDGE